MKALKKKVELNRREMPKQTPEFRKHNFCEVELGFLAGTAVEEAGRCNQCTEPTCKTGCPIGIDIPEFIKSIAYSKFERGIRIIRDRNPMPGVCGRVCPSEQHCENTCLLNKTGSPVSIAGLERFLADWECGQLNRSYPEISPFTGRKAAVVGGGPAGLMAAGDLIRLGHKVTVFESFHEPGGVLCYGIPEFRLPKSVVRREVEYLTKLGVAFVTDFVVGTMRTIDSILEEYDAVFVATGIDLPSVLEIPGVDLQGVYSASQYLTSMKMGSPIKNHKWVAVLGGGNTAVDCARTALRLEAEAMVLCGRPRWDISTRPAEIVNAEEEGVVFEFMTLPTRCLGENGWVVAVECSRANWETDSQGQKRAIPIEGSGISFPVDCVIFTTGNSPNPLIAATTPGLEMGERGNILVHDSDGRTSKERVWAGGDVTSGASTVIQSMAQGRKAARSIHQFLCSL
jgi:glutamate synthase (NADPH) small chain